MVFKYMRNEELIIILCINSCLPPKNELCLKPSRIGLKQILQMSVLVVTGLVLAAEQVAYAF